MIVRSLARVESELKEIDVEVSFTRGAPKIIFLGLPDQNIRESISSN